MSKRIKITITQPRPDGPVTASIVVPSFALEPGAIYTSPAGASIQFHELPATAEDIAAQLWQGGKAR